LAIYKKQLGLMCLILGGLAWPLGYASGYDVPQILPFHLFFVFAGVGLRGSHLFDLIKRKRNSPNNSN